MLPADLGTDVIKVERPDGGDDTRAWGPPFADGQATYHLSVNRNKRSLVLGLRDAEGREIATELVRRADVLVENFRPGIMDRLGLGWDAARELDLRLVYCSISGLGPGAGAALPGYDLLVQAVGGLMSITGADSKQRAKAGVALVDVLTGLRAAVGILAALRDREATGRGQQVSVNLLSSLLSSMADQSVGYIVAGVVPRPLGNRHPSIAPYEVFSTADRPIVIAVGTDRQFAALCDALGLAALPANTSIPHQHGPRRPRRRTHRAPHHPAHQFRSRALVQPAQSPGRPMRPRQRHRGRVRTRRPRQAAHRRMVRVGHLPRDLVPELGKLDLLGIHLRGYDGCAGTNAVSYGLACLELEAVDSGLRSFVSVQGSLSVYSIWKWGSEEQKHQWLPRLAAGDAIGCFGLTEPDFGSDPAGMRTHARRDGTDWILNGSNMWITNGSIADIATAWANTDEGVRGFLVPRGTPGFTTSDIHNKLSLRASVTSELSITDVRLPDSARLPTAASLRAPLSCLNEARFGIVFGAVGAARDALQQALTYADTRVQFGRPISAFQLTQRKLADMAVSLNTAMLLALHLGRLRDAGTLRPEQISTGKPNNVASALAIARQCRTILGANGISTEYAPLRHANNLGSVLTYEGTHDIHQLLVGQALTGHAAFR